MPFPENKYINQVYILQILDVATSNSVYSYIVAASERTGLPGWVRRETIYQLRMPLQLGVYLYFLFGVSLYLV